jgi:hypothetical protein
VSHMVIFRTPEGKPGYQPAETVEDAVSVVERLRNEDGVENVRIFRLEELAFEYRPYYKVELAGAPGDSPSTPTQIFSVPRPSDQADGDVAEPTGEAEHGDEAEHGEEAVASDDSATDASDSTEAPSNEAPAQPPWAAPPPPAPVIDQPAEVGGFGEDREGSAGSDEFSGQRRGLFGR